MKEGKNADDSAFLNKLKMARKGYNRFYGKIDWNIRPWGYPPIFAAFRQEVVKKEIVDRVPVEHELLLDVGCGYGVLVDFLARSRKIREYIGLDLSRVMLKMTKEKSSDIPIHVVLGVGEFLPFRKSSFDVIVCSETLEHVVDTKRVIDEMSRSGSDGGLLIITTPRKEWSKSWQRCFPLSFFLQVMAYFKVRKQMSNFGAHGILDIHLSEEQLRYFVTNSSFQILEHKPVAFFPPFHRIIPYTSFTISVYKRLNLVKKLQKLRHVQLLVATKESCGST